MMINGYYVHKKTGDLYIAFGEIINDSNKNCGQVMVLYGKRGKAMPALPSFAREKSEFLEKFEQIIFTQERQ
jgi:hypothetical protein